MAFNITSDGSPTPRKGASRPNMAAGDLKIDTSPEVLCKANGESQSHLPIQRQSFGSLLTLSQQSQKQPLGMSTMGNISMPSAQQQQSLGTFKVCRPFRISYDMNKLTGMQGKGDLYPDKSVMESLRQRLNERTSPEDPYKASPSGSLPMTPVADGYNSTPTSMASSAPSLLVSAADLMKITDDLKAAKDEIARLNQESHSRHVARSTIEHLGQGSEADYGYPGEVTEQTIVQLQNNFNASTRPSYAASPSFGPQYSGQAQAQARTPTAVGQPTLRRGNGYLNEPTHFPLDQGFRGGGLSNGMNSFTGNGMGAALNATYNSSITNPPSRADTAFDYSQFALSPMQATFPAPIGTISGTRLSPVANEFNGSTGMGPSPWNSQVSLFEILVATLNNTYKGSWRQRRLAVHASHGAHELPPTAGSQHELQLEVHRGQDRLQ